MEKKTTRRIDTNNFYRIILPILVLCLAGFFLYLMFAMPDWVLNLPTIYPAKFAQTTVVPTV